MNLAEVETKITSAAIIAIGSALALLEIVILLTVTPFRSAEASSTNGNTDAGNTATMVGKENNNDVLQGTEGSDVIVGLGGDDLIFGNGGDDVICGGHGDDILIGGAGDDTLLGDVGNDTLRGDPGNDALLGGAGEDNLAVEQALLTMVTEDQTSIPALKSRPNPTARIENYLN